MDPRTLGELLSNWVMLGQLIWFSIVALATGAGVAVLVESIGSQSPALPMAELVSGQRAARAGAGRRARSEPSEPARRRWWCGRLPPCSIPPVS
jgi:hypothetical protein